MNSSTAAAVRRIAAVRRAVAEIDLDGLLVSHLPNIRYLTGFTGSNGWLIVGANEMIFVTDGRYERQAAQELEGVSGCELVIYRDGVLEVVGERAATALGPGRIGFEGQYLSVSDWEGLTAESDSIEWLAADDVIGGLRAVKDDDEIAAMETAAHLAATALEETLGAFKPGVREADIARELDYRMRKLGAERPAFETIVASGPRTALPHAGTGERAIEEGDLVLCDLGASWRGYCSDLTRTFVAGEPDSRQAEVYETVLEAHRSAREALREGAKASDVDRAARDVFESKNLGGEFPHSTGHGVGLEVHESPRLHINGDEPLRANMVVTVEPGLYFPDWGGVRIEDDYVVNADGPRPLVELVKDRLVSLPL